MPEPLTSESTAELRQLTHIQFGLLSPEEIKSMSVCEITTPLAYVNGIPVDNGLMDLRMGTADRGFRCKTCGMDMNECPGHFGHIELVKPCYHIGQMRAIVKILRCVCYHCSSLLLSPDHKQYGSIMRIKNKSRRLASMLKLCQSMKRCNGGFDDTVNENTDNTQNDPLKLELKKTRGCGNLLPRYTVEGGFKLHTQFPDDANFVEGDTDRKKLLSASRVHQIFKRISDSDCYILGLDPAYSRPDWMIITVFACPPPQVRPAVMFDSVNRSNDDLTYKLSDIVKINTALRKQESQGAAEHILQDYSDLLQYHTAICRI